MPVVLFEANNPIRSVVVLVKERKVIGGVVNDNRLESVIFAPMTGVNC